MTRTIVGLILWHIRGLKYHWDIFTSSIRKLSLLHYPSHLTKKMTDSQQTVYTKMMIEGISKLFKQPPYWICDDTRCFTKNLNRANFIHKTKKKLWSSSGKHLHMNKTYTANSSALKEL